MRLVFFSSSSFTIPILNDIYNCQGKSLLEIILTRVETLNLILDQQKSVEKKLSDLLFEKLVIFLSNNLANLSQSEAQELKADPSLLKIINLLNSPIQFVGAATQPDSLNRGKLQQSEITKWCLTNQVSVFQPEKINNQFEQWLAFTENDFDIALVASFGQIINQKTLNSAKLGWLNWHPSKLPKYRGPSPMQQCIYDGNTATALSWIKMSKAMDAGEIYLQIPVEIPESKTFIELAEEMGNLGQLTWPMAILSLIIAKFKQENPLKYPSNLDQTSLGLKPTLNSSSSQSSKFIEEIYTSLHDLAKLLPNIIQNESEATFTKMLNKPDSQLNIAEQTGQQIYNHYRAFIAFPKTLFYSKYFEQNVRLDIVNGVYNQRPLAKPINLQQDQDILEINEEWSREANQKDYVLLKCANQTYLKIAAITLENGKKINLRGFQW